MPGLKRYTVNDFGAVPKVCEVNRERFLMDAYYREAVMFLERRGKISFEEAFFRGSRKYRDAVNLVVNPFVRASVVLALASEPPSPSEVTCSEVTRSSYFGARGDPVDSSKLSTVKMSTSFENSSEVPEASLTEDVEEDEEDVQGPVNMSASASPIPPSSSVRWQQVGTKWQES